MSGRILSTVHRPDNRKKRRARPVHEGAARNSLLLWWATAQAKAENVGEGTKKEQTQPHRTARDEPDAPLSCSECHRPCSTARQRTVVPRSGRRGRRFKSCHPDHRHRSPTCANAALRWPAFHSSPPADAPKEQKRNTREPQLTFRTSRAGYRLDLLGWV